jgi:hypothetical protein
MSCGTRITRLAAEVAASFVKERAARTWLTAGFGSGDCARVRPWRVRWLPCPEATTLASRRVRSSDRRVRTTDPLLPGGCSRRHHVSRSPLILNGSTRSSMLAFAPRARDARRRALFGETSLHDAYTAINHLPTAWRSVNSSAVRFLVVMALWLGCVARRRAGRARPCNR